MSRTQNLFQVLKEQKLDGFIITNPINIFYLTGFRGVSPTERESILVFAGSSATLIAPALYQAEAKSLNAKGLKIKIVRERNQIFELTKKLLIKSKRIGFEAEDMTVSELKEFRLDSKSKFVPTKNLIEDLRLFKTLDEIEAIEKAQIISIKAFEKLSQTIKVGQTEAEIADKLAKIIKSLGGEGLAFESIIATGPNAALPHYMTGREKTKKGEVLLLDFGAKFKNYNADITRTIFVGRPKSEQQNIYELVKKAQSEAIESVIDGMKAADAYHAANKVFKKQKLDKYFIHGLGHGIGLEVHERPYLRPTIDDELAENMVFSIEPGLYFPSWGGVRIEDLVLIKDGKAKILGGP